MDNVHGCTVLMEHVDLITKEVGVHGYYQRGGIKHGSMHASKHGSKHASKHGSTHGSMHGSMHGSKHGSMLGSMLGWVHGSMLDSTALVMPMNTHLFSN